MRLPTIPCLPLLSLLCAVGPITRSEAAPLDVWHLRWNGNVGSSGIAYGNGVFVAVVGDGSLLISSDGSAWSRFVAPPVLGYKGVFFGGGAFYTYGAPLGSNSLQYILKSTDGLNWTKIYESNFAIKAGAYAGNRLIFVGARVIVGTINPPSWTEFGGVPMLSDITYGQGRFVACGAGNYSYPAYVLSSVDGLAWRYDYGPNPNMQVYGIAYGSGQFAVNIRTNIQAAVLVSSNLASWDKIVISTTGSGNMGPVVYGGNQFIGSHGLKTYTSPDGLNWSYCEAASNAVRFAFAQGSFVATTWSDTIIQSDEFTTPSNFPPTALNISLFPGVTINGTEGLTYRMESATNLTVPVMWSAITNVTLPHSPFLWIDATPAPNRKFYRSVQIE